MPRLCMLLVLSCVWMTACTGGEPPSGPTTISAADWSKVGETETYVYYADCLATDMTSLENTGSWSHDRS